MDTEDAEDKVVAKLGEQGLRSERFPRETIGAGKTPDRRVYCADEFAFYLEVKEIEDIVTHGLGDSILDRIAARIHDAVGQFDSVNGGRGWPNVLAFVNRNHLCGALDLVEVVTGHRLLEGGGAAPIGFRWSEGRICDEKWRIDLWLWFDCHNPDQVFFNSMDRRHRERLASLFGIDAGGIPDVAEHFTRS